MSWESWWMAGAAAIYASVVGGFIIWKIINHRRQQ